MAFVQLMGYNPVLQPRLCLLDWIGLVRLAFGIALLAGITLLGLIWLGIALLGLVGLALRVALLAGITLLGLIWLGIALPWLFLRPALLHLRLLYLHLGLLCLYWGLALEINILVFRRKGLPLGTVLLCAIF